jgi:uridine phosphorylase
MNGFVRLKNHTIREISPSGTNRVFAKDYGKRDGYPKWVSMTERNGVEPGIIRPQKGKRDPGVGTEALMIMVPSDLAQTVRVSGAREVDFSSGAIFRLFLLEKPDGPPVAIAGPFIGAPHAVVGIEKLIAMGAESIWVTGWCGSLQPGVRIGDFVIPTGAVSEEGTSVHYPLGDRPIRSDEDLSGGIVKALNGRDLKYHKGRVWTTDAPYRETPSKVKHYQSMGVLAVDMEMAALMTVARFRGIRLGGLLVVSDELFSLAWRKGFSDKRFQERVAIACDLMLALTSQGKA